MFLAPDYDQVDFMVPEYLGLPSEINSFAKAKGHPKSEDVAERCRGHPLAASPNGGPSHLCGSIGGTGKAVPASVFVGPCTEDDDGFAGVRMSRSRPGLLPWSTAKRYFWQ